MTEAEAPTVEVRRMSGLGLATAISLLVTYGTALGAVYMRGYWGTFGIDPFQYGSTSDISVAGLAAVAVSTLLILLGAWFGHVFAVYASKFGKGQLLLGRIVFFIVPGALIALGIFGYWWVALGFAGVVLLGLMIIFTIELPTPLRAPPAAFGIALLLVYVPLSAHALGQCRAVSASDVRVGRVLDLERSILNVEIKAPAKLIGRIGGDVVIWEAVSGAVIMLPAAAEVRLVNTLRSAEPTGNQEINQERDDEHR